jgi:hypothetical protein
MSFTTLKACINLFRGHARCFELSKPHRVLPGVVTVQCRVHWKCRMFQKELCNGIPNVTVWRVLRKCLHLKAYKLSFLEHLELRIVCTPLSLRFS